MERVVYNTNNQPKRATFKYEQEGLFCLGVAKVEGQAVKIIGKRDRCLQKINEDRIGKNKEAYFVVVTMGRKN